MRKTVASLKAPTILASNLDRRTADICVGGLFNVLGGIKARISSTGHQDTNFQYDVIAENIKSNQVNTAVAFCTGVRYAMSR